uniref:Dicer-like protein02 n=1 Tax=Stentor coeruleus TaxID=5963 RepID=A0A060BG49_9CILI|nr:dicer-like protein02 [Stentor coeruleus]
MEIEIKTLEKGPYKKLKCDKENVFEMRNYSSVLSEPFLPVATGVKVFMYSFHDIPGFCICFPISYSPLPTILKDLGVRNINLKDFSYLRSFQNLMWSDLFRTSFDKTGDLSYANYLIAPTNKKNISWASIKTALGVDKKTKFTSLNTSTIEKQVYLSPPSKSKYYYVMKISKHTQASDIINNVSKKSLYSQEIPDDIHREITEKAIEMFNDALKTHPVSYFPLVLLRPVKVARKKEGLLKKKHTPVSLKIVPQKILEIFYLTRKQVRNASKLIKALIALEKYTYLIEFVDRFKFTGDFSLLRDATTSPQYDNLNNCIPIINLGHSILKIISSLQLYFRFPDKSEYSLTETRSNLIKNKNLSKINMNQELFYYLRCSKIKQKSFRPAYYTGPMLSSEITILTEKFSDKILADEVKSLIGAFYLSSGFVGAGIFIYKLRILPIEEWLKTKKQLDSSYKGQINANDMRIFKFKNFDDLIPRPENFSLCQSLDYESLEKLINYKFQNTQILDEAFTHKSINNYKNYERLEFLGDAIIDTIVVTNIFNIKKLSPEKLTLIKHILINNPVLSRLAISLGLQNYIKSIKEVYDEILKYFTILKWEEDLLDYGVYNSYPPKCLNDVFLSLIGAVLIDSGNLDLTCKVFTPFIKNLIVYLVQNEEKYDMNVRYKLKTFCQKNNRKLETRTRVDNIGIVAEIYVAGEYVCESVEQTSWMAKQLASKKAYYIISK